jgi:hypothetical protein
LRSSSSVVAVIVVPMFPCRYLCRHGFILCGTQSTKITPAWYKTYAIIGVVSIPTYKKGYAGMVFEFPENNGRHKKSSLPCLDLLSYLLSDFDNFF